MSDGLDWIGWIGWISLTSLTTRSPYGDKKRMFDTIDYYSLVIILESSKFRELQMTLLQDFDICSLHVGVKARVATILDVSAVCTSKGKWKTLDSTSAAFACAAIKAP